MQPESPEPFVTNLPKRNTYLHPIGCRAVLKSIPFITKDGIMNISNTANTWLSQFKIEVTSNANRVFGNGRQQLEATVSVSPRGNGTITTEQLNSITLVTLDDDGVYRELTHELRVSRTRDTLFDYYAASGSAPLAHLELKGAVLRQRFYISSSRVGGSLDRVYARISKNADTHHVTDGGAFNSSIIIESLTPLRYEHEDFVLTREDTVSKHDTDIDIYYLTFKAPGRRIIKSIPYDPVWSGIDVWSTQAGRRRKSRWPSAAQVSPSGGEQTPRHHSYYSDCYSRQTSVTGTDYRFYYIHYAIEMGTALTLRIKDSTITVNNKPGHMNFVRAKTYYGPFENPPNEYRQQSRWGLLDPYGNETRIELTQGDSGNTIAFKRYD
ncbi:Uncharacterized protein ALO80_00590 [Pseudomonas caricapapayae]|nr:Uncharacterized protein ALO80_00590 [Pseudomonas caricapapayae]